jgi:hypothetical protein
MMTQNNTQFIGCPLADADGLLAGANGSVHMQLTVQGVDYMSLVANQSSMDVFTGAIKDSVANQSGVDPSLVDVSLTPGSVIADIHIRPPESESIESVVSRLSTHLEDVDAAVLAALSDKATQLADALVGNISIRGAVEDRDHWDSAKEDLSAVLGSGGAGLGDLLGNAQHHVKKALGDAHHHAKKAASHVHNATKHHAGRAKEFFANKSEDLLTDSTEWLKDKSKQAGEMLKNKSKAALKGASGAVGGAVRHHAGKAGDWINNKTGIGDAWDESGAGDALSTVGQHVSHHAKAIGGHLKNASEWVDDKTGISDSLEDLGEHAKKHGKHAASWVGNKSKDAAKVLGGKLKEHTSHAAEKARNKSKEAVQNALEDFGDAVKKHAKDAAAAVGSAAHHHAHKAANWTKTHGKDLVEDAHHHVKKAVSAVQDHASKAADWSSDKLEDHAEWAKNASANAGKIADAAGVGDWNDLLSSDSKDKDAPGDPANPATLLAEAAKQSPGNASREGGKVASGRATQMKDEVSDGMVEEEASHIAHSKKNGVYHTWGQ